ncbi:MAG TPA: nucleotide sugar dehydrogenase [Pseudolabrys sp.]|nr:nucleotide sugar dehydrogenase [Pseudolabrys sp.]
MHISVVGLGKLGAPLVAVLASKGFHVTGADKIPAQVAALEAHRAPVAEPGLGQLIAQSAARIEATTDVKRAVVGSEVTFVVVPTPSGKDGKFSNAHVLSAMHEIGGALRGKSGYHLVVVTSTVMPGATGGPIRHALETACGRPVGPDLGLCYNPEFIALGNVIHDMLNPDFVLIGESDKRAGDLLASIYARVCDNRPQLRRMNLVNAEVTKIAVNSFVTTKISFANMVSEICDRLHDADAGEVLRAVGSDSRIGGKYLAPALGYGGPCFPRDNAAFTSLARAAGASADIAEATDVINRRQVARVVKLVRSLLPRGTVGVLGLSYKPDTAVVEESQGIAIASQLSGKGYHVIAHDPLAGDTAHAVLGTAVEVTAEPETCVARADILVIATPWPNYKNIPPAAFRRERQQLIVIDCWRLLPLDQFSEVADIVHLGKGSAPGQQPYAAVAIA